MDLPGAAVLDLRDRVLENPMRILAAHVNSQRSFNALIAPPSLGVIAQLAHVSSRGVASLLRAGYRIPRRPSIGRRSIGHRHLQPFFTGAGVLPL
jgi:hypothetical protein